ncbi:MAG: hypothetical protein CSA72_06920 [Rhodobacterales bacterium]|nr:MAG: hypothetical protein CSA72_06920 [Rhodobacterales bacterium]
MIRSVTALFVFALLLCGWIVLRASNPSEPEQPAQVTRAPVAEPILADIRETGASAAMVNAASVAPQDSAAVERAVAAALAPASSAERGATDAVLAGLSGIKPTAEAPIVLAQASSDADVQNVLQGILAARGLAGGDTPSDAPVDLGSVVQQALAQGQSDAYVEALLQEAASKGVIDVHHSLHTADGQVDTRVLLQQLVKQSGGGDSADAPHPTTAAPIAIAGPGVETRLVQRAGETETYHFYTVQLGDSLGGIAHRFYGDAALFGRIFEANRQLLSSPNQIRRGQRLVIPKLEG